ncbi:MAG: hypothetical protein U1F83_19065 [Verrucomicrobiota bacterium]
MENSLPAEEFARFKDRHFQDRIERIQKHVQQPGFSAAKREQFEQWAARLGPIREIRNHIAHGLLRLSLAEDEKTLALTISLPSDIDGSNSPEARHMTFEELLKASTELINLTESFTAWEGTWVRDCDIRF